MTEEERIVVRILDVIPPRSFEMATFLSLFRVRFSEKTETACVTCGDSPEFLLNRDFVAANCQTDEHLFMLVMHELYHVILGHTALFPRSSEVRNIVFDAVINAILCSLFPDPAFTSFFTDYYPSDQMPFALLRPKGEGTPPEAEAALKLLYDGSGAGTYHDVYEALLASGCVQEVAMFQDDGHAGSETLPGGEGRGTHPACPNKHLLLGSHGEGAEKVSPELADLIRKVTEKWPHPARPFRGQGQGAEDRTCDFDADADPSVRLRRGVRLLMRLAATPGKKEVRGHAVRERDCEATTFLPDWRDRSHEARAMTLGDALAYATTVRLKRPSNRDSRQAFVYFDVSGSVADEVPSVAAALLPHVRRGLCKVHVFSTTVHPASVRDLAERKFDTTGGTDIDCVLEHALYLPPRKRPHAVIVITDGFTGQPNAALAARFRSEGMRLFVGLVQASPDSNQEGDLASIAEKFIRLF